MLIEGHLQITSSADKTQKSAVLSCSLGEFVVYHASVSDLADGSHHGVFDVLHIKAGHNRQGGRVFFELIAEIKTLLFPYFDPVTVKTAEIKAEMQQATNSTSVQASQGQLAMDVINPTSEEINPALFGELWPLGECVKLDPTLVDRAVFRQQRDVLKKLNYRIDDKTQTWHKSEASL